MSNPQQHPSGGENLRGSHRAPAQLGTFQTAQVLLGLISASNWPRCLATVCWLLSSGEVTRTKPWKQGVLSAQGRIFPPCITLCCSLAALGSVLSMPWLCHGVIQHPQPWIPAAGPCDRSQEIKLTLEMLHSLIHSWWQHQLNPSRLPAYFDPWFWLLLIKSFGKQGILLFELLAPHYWPVF